MTPTDAHLARLQTACLYAEVFGIGALFAGAVLYVAHRSLETALAASAVASCGVC